MSHDLDILYELNFIRNIVLFSDAFMSDSLRSIHFTRLLLLLLQKMKYRCFASYRLPQEGSNDLLHVLARSLRILHF
jgi:hypothetical protein